MPNIIMCPVYMLLLFDKSLLISGALHVARRREAIVYDGYKASVEVEAEDACLAYVSNVYALDT